MTTRVTEGAGRERLFFLLGLPPSFLASRGFDAQRSRARALVLLNLKKKRDCSQSTLSHTLGIFYFISPAGYGQFLETCLPHSINTDILHSSLEWFNFFIFCIEQLANLRLKHS